MRCDNTTMRPLARTCVVLLALVLAGTASARTHALVVDRGIVQSVSSSALVLRALDGSTVTITIGPATRVRVNGQPASIGDIRPGFVAAALHDGAQPAVEVRAFGKVRVPLQVDRGVIVSVGGGSIRLREPPDGRVVMLAVDASTQVVLNGAPASLGDLRPGFLAAVAHHGDNPAVKINARSRR